MKKGNFLDDCRCHSAPSKGLWNNFLRIGIVDDSCCLYRGGHLGDDALGRSIAVYGHILRRDVLPDQEQR